MNAEEILMQARKTTGRPENWVIFPLLRAKVLWGIAGWVGGLLMGGGLLALAFPIVVPDNYRHGVLVSVFTTLLLGIFAFIAVGSFFLIISDMRRLMQADKHIMVITGTDFVKQEGKSIIQVPLAEIRYVTPRGRAPIERNAAAEREEAKELPGVAENVLGFVIGRGVTQTGVGWRKKRMRTPSSLAFMDARTEREVTVVTDAAYGDPFLIAAVLKKYTGPNQ